MNNQVQTYDQMVLKVQQWLNNTYRGDKRFNEVPENGKTGWPTIYGLRRALQIVENLPEGSNAFGPKTYEKCPNVNQGDTGDIVYIIQGGLWCKGYNPGGFDGKYGIDTYGGCQKTKK